MANWCSNRVEFIGEHNDLIVVKASFLALARKEKNERCGQLPTFVNKGNGGYFFNIVSEGDQLYYDTKWAPNTDILVQIANEYGVGFIHNYDEPGNLIFGETHYLNGTLTEIDLDFGDFAQYEYDEDTNTYRFENQNYESSEDILKTLLNRKKAEHKQQDLNTTDND